MTATTIEISLEREIERKIKKSITLYIDTFFSLSISYIPVVYESNLILQDRKKKNFQARIYLRFIDLRVPRSFENISLTKSCIFARLSRRKAPFEDRISRERWWW